MLEAPARGGTKACWIVSAAVALVGLIASAALGAGVLVMIAQRDAARRQLAGAEKELASRKATVE